MFWHPSPPLPSSQVGHESHNSDYMHVDDVKVMVDWHLAENRDLHAAMRKMEEELARERFKRQKLIATHRTFEYRSLRRFRLLKSQIKHYKERAQHWYDRYYDYQQTLIDVTGGYHREALKISNAPYEQNIFHTRQWMPKRARIHRWLDAAAEQVEGPLPSGL